MWTSFPSHLMMVVVIVWLPGSDGWGWGVGNNEECNRDGETEGWRKEGVCKKLKAASWWMRGVQVSWCLWCPTQLWSHGARTHCLCGCVCFDRGAIAQS